MAAELQPLGLARGRPAEGEGGCRYDGLTEAQGAVDDGGRICSHTLPGGIPVEARVHLRGGLSMQVRGTAPPDPGRF